MAQRGTARTLTAHFRDVLRAQILAGAVPPGARLQPAALADTHGTSTTVIREALAQLATERLVQAIPNKGFFVIELSLSEFEDLTLVRAHNDTLALRLAMERGGVEWEAAIMTAFHVLSRTERRSVEDPAHTTEAWAAAHRDYHMRLVSGCQVGILITTAAHLFDATELYRRWSAPSLAARARSVDDEHREILDACLSRDVRVAEAALRRHYEATLKVILSAGLRDQAEVPSSRVIS